MPVKITGSKTEDEVNEVEAKTHPLMGKTNAEIDTYVDANVTDLASARVMFKIVLKLIKALMKRI